MNSAPGSFGDRVKQLQVALSPNVSAFAEALASSRTAVYDWFKLKQPSDSAVGAIVSAFPTVSVKWLREGEGEMLVPDQGVSDSAGSRKGQTDEKEPEDRKVIRVPVAQEGHGAGKGVINDGPGSVVELSPGFLRRLTGGRLPHGVSFSFVRGESMLPYLSPGTPILLEEVDQFTDGGRYAIYYDDSEEDEVKRVERLGGGRLRVSSDNRAFPPRIYEHIEGHWYKDVGNGHELRLRIRGRVVFPPDTASAVVGELRDFAKDLLRELASR